MIKQVDQRSQLDVLSSMDFSNKGMFNDISQARQYRELLFLLKNGSDSTLTTFLDYILAQLAKPRGPNNAQTNTRNQYL